MVGREVEKLRMVIRCEEDCLCGVGCRFSEVGFLTVIIDQGRREVQGVRVACVHCVFGVM